MLPYIAFAVSILALVVAVLTTVMGIRAEKARDLRAKEQADARRL